MENITNTFLANNFGPMVAAQHHYLETDLKKSMIGKTYYEVLEDIAKNNLKNDKKYESIPDDYKPYYIKAMCYQTIKDKKIGMDIIAETVVADEMNIIIKKYPYIFGNSEVIQTPRLERYDYDMALFVDGVQMHFEGENKSSQEKGAIHLGSTIKDYIENILTNPNTMVRWLFRSMYKNTDTKNDVITSMDVELLINSLRINKPYDDKNFYVFNIYDLKSGFNKAKHIITSHENFNDSLKILIEQYCKDVYTIENVRKVYLMTMVNTILYNNNMNINTDDEYLKMIIDNEPEIYKEAIEYIYENDGFNNDCNTDKKSASKKYRENQKNLYGKNMVSFPKNTFIRVLKSGNNRDINNPADYKIYKKVAPNRIVLLDTAKSINSFIKQNTKTNRFKDVTSEYNDMQIAA